MGGKKKKLVGMAPLTNVPTAAGVEDAARENDEREGITRDGPLVATSGEVSPTAEHNAAHAHSVHFPESIRSPLNHIQRVPTPPTHYLASPHDESEKHTHPHFAEEVASPLHTKVPRISTPTNLQRLSSFGNVKVKVGTASSGGDGSLSGSGLGSTSHTPCASADPTAGGESATLHDEEEDLELWESERHVGFAAAVAPPHGFIERRSTPSKGMSEVLSEQALEELEKDIGALPDANIRVTPNPPIHRRTPSQLSENMLPTKKELRVDYYAVGILSASLVLAVLGKWLL